MNNKTLSDKRKSYSSGEQAILNAAESLFSEKGFDAVSMSAIAKLANTSKPNIYHHFKSKNELFISVMRTAIHQSSQLLDELEDAPGTLKQRLTCFSAGQLNNIINNSRGSRLILREALSGGTDHGREIAKHVVDNIFTRLVAMVEKGQKNKEFRNDIDPALAAFMIIASNMFFFQAGPVMKHIEGVNFTEDITAYSSDVMDILFNGLLVEGEHEQ